MREDTRERRDPPDCPSHQTGEPVGNRLLADCEKHLLGKYAACPVTIVAGLEAWT